MKEWEGRIGYYTRSTRGISGNPSHGGSRAHILDSVWLRWQGDRGVS